MHPRDAWLEEVGRLHQVIRNGDRSFDREVEIVEAVRQARNHGATWQNVGDAMGTSRQYVHKRFYPQIEEYTTSERDQEAQ